MKSELLRCPECGNTARLDLSKMLECFRSFEALRPSLAEDSAFLAEPQDTDAGSSTLRDFYAERPDQLSAELEEFLRCVESFLGRCDCGGRFTPWAEIRCPRCQSLDIEKTFLGTVD